MDTKEKDALRGKRLEQKSKLLENREFVEEYDTAAVEYEVAKVLYEARKDSGITQKEIASILDTKQSAVSRIEKGCNVTIETIAKYAEACGKKVKLELCDTI